MAFILYGDFTELKTSDRLDSDDIDYYNAVRSRKMDPVRMDSCLQHLCIMLTKHYGKAPIILMDEYDSVMNASYGQPKEHELIMSFMRTFLSTALKSNDSMRFAILTGVTRMSLETACPNLNNLYFCDVTSKKFDGMYGFNRAEVEKILIDNGHGDKIKEALEWYGGYRFGDTDVCCPWSILYYIDEGCEPETYWADTSSNSIVADLVSKDDLWTWMDLGMLCSGGAILGGFDDQIEYCDRDSADLSIYSVMVATGYLTECPEGCRRVSIPNKEILEVFRAEILDRFGDTVNEHLNRFLKAIKTGDVPAMTSALTELMESLGARIPSSELPFEAFMAGLAVREFQAYEILFDRDFFDGYHDIRMKSRGGSDANIVMAIRYCKGSDSGKSMEALAKEAMDRIREKKHCDGMEGTTYLYGIAFLGRFPTVVAEKL